jgi:hypothetical protein
MVPLTYKDAFHRSRLDRRALGAYRYNAALGEAQRLALHTMGDAEAIGR